jgi:hypothetical protein
LLGQWHLLYGGHAKANEAALSSLHSLTAKDVKNFTQVGYQNIATYVNMVICDLSEKVRCKKKYSAADSVSATYGGSHFWRGFVSSVESAKPAFIATGYNGRKNSWGRPREPGVVVAVGTSE